MSYLNTLPLIEGLAKLKGLNLTLTAPANLLGLLLDGSADAALVSSIDYQRSPRPLAILPVGMIGSDGPTMTVRLFSRCPIPSISSIAADADSHTSVALLGILLDELHGIRPTISPFDADAHRARRDHTAAGWPEAVLLIGDKVITDSPPAAIYPHQLDLGQAWRTLTGLPFVYAVWMCAADCAEDPAITLAADLLDRQRRHNATRLRWIATTAAPLRGWPADLAHTYLSGLLRFDFDDRAEQALTLFHTKAHTLGLTHHNRALMFAGASAQAFPSTA